MKTPTFFTLLLSFFAVLSSNNAQSQPDTVYVLHYTETTGYNHGTANDSRTMFTAFMDSLSTPSEVWKLVHDTDGDEFNDLAKYRGVIFSNTSGNSGLNAGQRANFEIWIANGGNYIGIHAATDTYRHSTANGKKTGTWDYYAENVSGASVQENPNHTSSSHVDSVFIWNTIYASFLPPIWIKEEEYYYWENGYLNPDFHEVARVGQTGGNSYDAARMVAHFDTLSGGGLTFYTSLGHKDDNFEDFDDPNKEFYFFGVMMLNALENMVPRAVPFAIVFPEEAISAGLEPGYFHFETEQRIRTYEVFGINGQVVHRGEFDGFKIPTYNQTGIWVYKTNGFAWKHGVR